MEAHHQHRKHESHNPHKKHEPLKQQKKHDTHDQHKTPDFHIPASLRLFDQKVVRPITHNREPYVNSKTLQELHIHVRSLSFWTGELPEGVQPFLEPVAPSLIQKWLDGSKPWSVFGRDFTTTREDECRDMTAQTVAHHFGYLIYGYLNGTEDHDALCPVPDFSNWRRHNNDMEELNRLDKHPAHWRVSILQSFSQGLKMNNAEDYTKPHIICFITENATLIEKDVLTSELATIAVLALNTAADSCYNHSYIPITVITGSARHIRIVQGVLDVPNGKLELRMSEIVSFDEGLAANWDKFLKLLGWFIARPVGKTV